VRKEERREKAWGKWGDELSTLFMRCWWEGRYKYFSHHFMAWDGEDMRGD